MGTRRGFWAVAMAAGAALAVLAAASLAQAGSRVGVVAARVPPIVRPPAGPWLLVNTSGGAPTVSWSGPALVEVDSPEVLSGRLVRGASGGTAAAHLLYRDRAPDLPSTFWLFAFVRNALDHPVDVWLTLRPSGAGPIDVRYGRGGVAARTTASRAVAAGRSVAAALSAVPGPGFGPAQRVAAGAEARAVWRVGPGQVLALWWPIRVTGPGGRATPFSLALWEGPSPAAPAGGALPPGPTGVVRATVPHAVGSVTLVAPAHGAWAYDLDNDAPAPGGGAGGSLCPPAVCLDGAVTTAGGRPFTAGADPLPGELEAGVDALDAPGHRPAVAIWHDGAVLRTGNYGDYGARLVIRLTAPRGRLVYAAAVPGYDRAIPWVGTTRPVAGPETTWQLPSTLPPPGAGYEIVAGATTATVTTTLTPGAYAPWRIVLWSEPAGAASGTQGP